MTEPRGHRRPRVRHGAHRGGRAVLAAIMPSVLAVAAVAALITSLAVWQGEQADQPSAASSTGRPASSSAVETDPPATSAPPTPAESPATKDTAEQSSSADTRVEGNTSENTDVEGTKVEGTKAAATDKEPAPGIDMQVVVLNQTTRRGLAATVAEQLRSAGWPVPAVGNFRGLVPSTTVYYPPGGEAGALAVAADLPVQPRVRPSFGNLSETRLTVVVTDSYPS